MNTTSPDHDPKSIHLLRQLLAAQTIASLGTVKDGEPFVSMTPFVLEPQLGDFIIHVSALAAHTRHMQNNPKVSLMIMAPPSLHPVATAGASLEAAAGAPISPREDSPQATPRVTLQGTASTLERGTAPHARAQAQYLARFPQSLDLFGFADFSLIAISPSAVRWVAGFAKAYSFTGEQFLQHLARRP